MGTKYLNLKFLSFRLFLTTKSAEENETTTTTLGSSSSTKESETTTKFETIKFSSEENEAAAAVESSSEEYHGCRPKLEFGPMLNIARIMSIYCYRMCHLHCGELTTAAFLEVLKEAKPREFVACAETCPLVCVCKWGIFFFFFFFLHRLTFFYKLIKFKIIFIYNQKINRLIRIFFSSLIIIIWIQIKIFSLFDMICLK